MTHTFPWCPSEASSCISCLVRFLGTIIRYSQETVPDAVFGALGDGGEEEGGYTMEEVAKHNKKGDVWVVLSNIGTQAG